MPIKRPAERNANLKKLQAQFILGKKNFNKDVEHMVKANPGTTKVEAEGLITKILRAQQESLKEKGISTKRILPSKNKKK